MTPADILIIIAPEYVGNPNATGAILVAEMEVAPGLCGDKRPLLVAYLAAHILTVGGRTAGSSGDIASVKEGGTAISYNNTTPEISTTGLSDTSYGREYDRISRGCIFAVRTRVTNVNINCGC